MIGYSDASFSSTLRPAGTPPKSASPLIDQHRITDKRGAVQLTPLWEYVVRTRSIPKDLNLEDIFIALSERLRDPEWEVRQHALRVLVDVIPVMDDTLDQKMEILLGDLVGNLGHPGPAVRKGALDSLKVYLAHSSSSDDTLRNIVYKGIENFAENQLQSDVVVGIILSLPSLIFPGRTKPNTIEYIIKTLINKLVQVTFQEVSLRSLARIRDMISPMEFDRILEDIQPNSRRDFELLCQVYDTHGQKRFNNYEHNDDDRTKWNDFNANIVNDNRWNSDSDSAGVLSQEETVIKKENDATNADQENNVPAGKVILETEIQFNSSTAVTMKILEEGESKSINDSDSDEDNRDCVVKVLSDSDNEEVFELRRRTPRRVRFGGEIVKLRTPDSDSNHPSDTDNDITITTNNDANNPVIEIKFITDGNKDGKRMHQSRSLIPIPVLPAAHKPKARSLPTSPNRKAEINSRTRLLYQSHPNLTRTHFFADKQNKNSKVRSSRNPKLKMDIPKKSNNYMDKNTSPNILHKEIELFHNLTRSPTHTIPEDNPLDQQLKTERKISTADSILLDNKKNATNTNVDAKLSSAESKKQYSVTSNGETILNTTDISDIDSNPGCTFSSFILKDSGSEGIQSDCNIPTIDTGDCLTCSSSGSEGVQTDKSWENSGAIDKSVIKDMHDKDDWRIRLQAFEIFSKELRKQEVQQTVQPYLSSLLHFLFTAEKHPRLQITVEDIIRNIFLNSSNESLKLCLPQLAMSLSKLGSPVGTRLALTLMQKLSARLLVQYVLEDPIMASRSAKTREGAIQVLICATRTFPSTEFDSETIAERVALVATDRKRRVRQATLDLLAVLAQIGQPGNVLDAAGTAVKDLPDRDRFLAAVRARISRRQLPIVEADGTIVYASPGVGHGADVEWVAAGSGSISPCSARSRKRAMTPATTTHQLRADSAMLPQRNMWSARRHQDTTESFSKPMQLSDNTTWSLPTIANKEDPLSKTYPGTQLWKIDQSTLNGNSNVRLNGSSGQLRPIYLLQPQQPIKNVRSKQLIPNGTITNENQTSVERNNSVYTRNRSSSPPVRLVQINGSTRTTRGQSSSPPDYARRNTHENSARRRIYPSDTSASGSSQSRGSPPRTNWRKEFQSAIPVPVSGEGTRNRFRRRNHDKEQELSASQPMIALPQHRSNYHYNQNSIGSAPTVHQHQNYSLTKSPSPTRFNVDKFNISQDSGINNQHTSSSGSESSDYYTPPAEPYLPLQTETISTNRSKRDDSFDQSDRSETPPAVQQPRERFINLENLEDEEVSTSDFDEHDGNKQSGDSQDDTDFVRSQIYHKLQEEHIASINNREPPFREKVSEKRLSKSHADLSEVKRQNRKTISSAPLVKHLQGYDNNLDDKKLSRQVEEESKSSQNSSIIDLKSITQSQTELRSINQSQVDLQSLNQSQIELRSLNESHDNLSINSDFRSQENLRSLNQSQADLKSLSSNQSQKDLRSLNQSQVDLRSINDSQTNLHIIDDEKSSPIKYPEIVRKKSIAKPKIDLKRRPSNVSTKNQAVFPDTLRSFPKPKEGFSEVVSQLESPDWEQSTKGLQGLVRLIRHHPETIEMQIHQVCVLLGRHIKNLRSQVARAACLAAGEMFTTHKRNLEMELEELACPLLHRTADTNKFLRLDANNALDLMCLNVTATRSVMVLSGRGASHHNAVVRSSTCRLLSEIVHRLGSQRVFQLPRETRDKILSVGANMLMEGSLETRKHAKNMFSVLSSNPQFQRAMSEAVAATTLRHISKILNSLK